ncbi:tryptophan--tRNA ligase [Buchananella hordeovulneris]|uniref:Tryptophan--tRNA ligase n=1 Tax=Buchananella hordeovulneris TaxID=52770 RepID=A0A1Q5PX62_9ACTO|nr:tryptophan--tRNA ligase [Buchananella hordeovulneris]OKL51980.1 tryptophan--tRNA ligase [Buchananella hordeovulneris]RRD53100.1 tryptophan--tRNA ligase [Buchananella hordeovulneris]
MTTEQTAADRLAHSTDAASLARTRERSAQIEAEIATDPSRFRVLTGDRPTGHLHLGHYFGTIRNRVRLQEAGVETWVLVADYQVITDRDSVGELRERVLSLVCDYLAVGIDPARSTIFAHSQVPALNQLMLPFLSLVTEAELHRNPTVKAEQEATGGRALSGLMLTYPVHQAADILFCGANLVPVGKDQLPHLEQARVIAQRFDKRYGRVRPSEPVFRRPEALLSEAELLLGTDGQKMSKSKGNTIELRMSADQTAAKLKKAVTDMDRVITYDPAARPEVSNLLLLAAMCTGEDPAAIAERIGDGGGGALKKVVTEAVNEYFAPIRARRAELAANEDYLLQVLRDGCARASEVADAKLADVQAAMQMTY